jgi:hypothetical protein
MQNYRKTNAIVAAVFMLFAFATANAGDTTAVAPRNAPDTAMTVAMHGDGPAEVSEPGRPMAAMAAMPKITAPTPQTANPKPGIKPAKIGEALAIILPAAVLVGFLLIPPAQ